MQVYVVFWRFEFEFGNGGFFCGGFFFAPIFFLASFQFSLFSLLFTHVNEEKKNEEGKERRKIHLLFTLSDILTGIIGHPDIHISTRGRGWLLLPLYAKINR